MTKPLSPGKDATYNHSRVVYSPFGAGPGAQFVLTADPWSFLTATINQRLYERPRGQNRTRLKRALYYADLAEAFFESGKESALPAAGTLAYYGVLNLVKCFLSMNKVDLEASVEHHGLSLVQGKSQTVQVIASSKQSLNLFAEFAKLLGKPVTGKLEVSVSCLSSHLPEIHEMAFTLGHLPGDKRGFLPINIALLKTEDDSYLFSEVSYEKKQITRVNTNSFYKGARRSYFNPSTERGNLVVHRCARRKGCDWDNFPRKYRNVCKEYSQFDIASLLTHQGYKYYCDLRNPVWHHLSYSLMMMYYIGTVARYRPSEMNDLLNSDMRPLVSEALAVIPGQMLYHLVSLCTSRNCVVPHSTIAS